jgi:hypothetical protein
MLSFRKGPIGLLGVGVVVGAVLVLGGCGKPTASVKGKVTYKGKLLSSGTVTFVAENATGFSPISADGSYSVLKAPVGPCSITVTTPKVPGGGMMMDPSKMGGSPISTTEAKAPEIEAPPRYADPKTSPLTFEVKPGENVFDIPLD